ncbi:hypothetical protein TGRH88_067640 [Toxoplasma gondii]|uniref:Uncharacterized protein n=1 Tax=Toxoplasma gondii TaxID=5811 RepID=A0A7J6K386_TOXGO|nr:hypothetical protein TGRH88_067640 [Toxoplasma gondii]
MCFLGKWRRHNIMPAQVPRATSTFLPPSFSARVRCNLKATGDGRRNEHKATESQEGRGREDRNKYVKWTMR